MAEVCEEILNSDRAIRFVAIGDENGGVLGFKAREDFATTLLPKYKGVMEKFGETWARVIWGIVDEVGKYAGKASRLIINYERANWVSLKVNGKIVVLSTDKEASPKILAAKVEKIVKKSFGLEKTT